MSTTKVKEGSFVKSVSLVSGATAFSRVLGLVREQVLAYFFGASLATDAFVTAFRIPNLLRDMFAEGALSSAFVPVFKEKLVRQSDQEAFNLANTVLAAVLLVVGMIVLLGIIAAPAIVFISAKGFTADPFKFGLTVSLTRLMFVYLLLVSLSAMVMGMLNSFGRFGVPAFAPAVFNLGMILSMFLLRHFFGIPIYAVAVGVLVGGAGQLAVQLPLLWRIGFRLRWRLDLLDEGLKKVVRLFTPMVIGMSAGRINILVNTLLASFLIEGSISYLNYSFRLMHFPLGVFAVALGTVALPKASEIAARGNMEELSRAYRQALGLNLLFIVPSAVFLAFVGPQLVSVIYQWGQFSAIDTRHTALALLHYSYGLIGFAVVRVTVPIFYALGDSRLPTRISILSVLVNMLLYYPMIRALDFAGLAAATSLAALLNAGLLLYYLPAKGVPVSPCRVLLSFFKLAIAACLAFYVAALVPKDFIPWESEVISRVLNLLFTLALGGVLYLLFCFALRTKELTLLKRGFFTKRSID